MNCEEARAILEEEMDEGAAGPSAAAAAEHVRGCADCRRYRDGLRDLEGRLRSEARELLQETPPVALERTLEALASARGRRGKGAERRPGARLRLGLAALACAAAVIVAAGLLAFRGPRDARGAPAPLTPEQREAARELEEARRRLVAELSSAAAARSEVPEAVGRRLVDGRLMRELDGIEACARAIELLILERLPVPRPRPEAPGPGAVAPCASARCAAARPPERRLLSPL
jgi:hypothetical protein